MSIEQAAALLAIWRPRFLTQKEKNVHEQANRLQEPSSRICRMVVFIALGLQVQMQEALRSGRLRESPVDMATRKA